jgi:hypothetical protein
LHRCLKLAQKPPSATDTKSLSPESRPSYLAGLDNDFEQSSRVPTKTQKTTPSAATQPSGCPSASLGSHPHSHVTGDLTGDGTGLQLPESFSIVRAPLHVVPLAGSPRSLKGFTLQHLVRPRRLVQWPAPSPATTWPTPFGRSSSHSFSKGLWVSAKHSSLRILQRTTSATPIAYQETFFNTPSMQGPHFPPTISAADGTLLLRPRAET